MRTCSAADDNVIVDFKYSASSKLTWWFDHHASAFLSEADESHFRQDKSGKKFHDPNFKSCTKFIAAIAKNTFGFEDPATWKSLCTGRISSMAPSFRTRSSPWS